MPDLTITAWITYSLLFTALYFEVFLLVSFLERRAKFSKGAGYAPLLQEQLPRIAIVVPCFNEEKTVASTLESLLALSYPKNKLEIIVVDDGSRDRTYDAVLPYTNDTRVRLFQKENGGKHTALNFALEHTNADLIGCLDADSTVAPDALERLAQGFIDPRIAAVTPGIHVKPPETILQRIQMAEYRLSIFIRNAFAGLGSIFITPGPFSIFRASTVRELGGWRNAHSTEDLELGLRLQDAGFTILNDPQATVLTSSPRTLKALFRQRVRWTYGFLRNVMDYRHMIGNPKYGNLGIIILPAALLSIFTAIYFAGHLVWKAVDTLFTVYFRLEATGWQIAAPTLDPFFLNTSIMWFLIYFAVILIVGLMCVGSFISVGSRRPPAGTILFLMLYSFIVPLWLTTAVVRAALNTGVRWR